LAGPNRALELRHIRPAFAVVPLHVRATLYAVWRKQVPSKSPARRPLRSRSGPPASASP
jgi:hypothetical protein